MSAETAVGDVARLSAPPIVMHPEFAGAAVAVEYDNDRLALVAREVDTWQLGQRIDTFRFRAVKTGTPEVLLRPWGTARPVNRVAR